jgi:hypothetical protein
MPEDDGWPNPATRRVAEEVRADPILLMEVHDRINSLQNDLAFEQLRSAAGAEVHGVWACRTDDAAVEADIDWPSLGESFTMELLSRGLDRDR